MLNRLSDINEKGEFISDIKSGDQRFALSLNCLITGRILVANHMILSATKALKIALRFSAIRKQFGPPDGPEQPLIDLQLQ